MNLHRPQTPPSLIRKGIASAVIASLLVTQQGFFFYEALAGQFVAPNIGSVGAGSGAGAAGSVGAAGVSRVSINNLNLTTPNLTAVSVLPTASSIDASIQGVVSVKTARPTERLREEVPHPHAVRARPTERLREAALPTDSGSGIPSPMARSEVPHQAVARKTAAAAEVSLRKNLSRIGRLLAPVKEGNSKREGKGSVASLSALRRFFDRGRKAEGDVAPIAATGSGVSSRRTPGLRRSGAPDTPAEFGGGDYARLKELKQILGEGTPEGDGWIEPFVFEKKGGRFLARAAGLEGFFYSKNEIERDSPEAAPVPQLDDYFKYLDALLKPIGWTADIRRELAAMRAKDFMSEGLRNRLLNEFLAETIKRLRGELAAIDRSQWGRSAHTYAILARAYNRLRPGKNFFDSLDRKELQRIREELGADQIWLLDIFEIGDIRRWGTGGGSPYALKGYRRIKDELGGVKAFQRFVERAHKMGFKVRTDFVPNHTSLDSELIERHPEAFIHILPPQHLSDEEIMAGTPRENHGPRSPLFYLIKSRNYPGREGRETKVLVHHPRTDFGDVMWIDMGQIDFSRRTARAWLIEQGLHLFGDKGIDSIRRDMAYYVLNEGYYARWQHILEDEKNGSLGWAKEAMEGLRKDFETRWKSLNNAEILEELTDAVKKRFPRAVMDDEAYAYFTGLSRTGADGVYGKNTHDEHRGQVGLYDALRSFNVPGIRAAIRNNMFRFWQRGASITVNFIGNHDESNPVDTFGRSFRAAAATALLGGPILTYNGFELGTGQREMLGDLPNSADKNKAIPFDVPVSINWNNVHEESRDFLRALFAARNRNLDLFSEGAGDVLEPIGETPIVAWTASRRMPDTGGQKSLLIAANYHWDWAWGHFGMGRPVLADFGAFEPRADRNYILRDTVRHKDINGGQPLVVERSGKELLEKGLFINLAPGDAHVFEIEEIDPSAPPTGPPTESMSLSRQFLSQDGANAIDEGANWKTANVAKSSSFLGRLKNWRKATWDDWTEILTNSAILAFLPLQVPQIIKNFGLMAAGTLAPISILPWMGYSTGILANMLLLSYFVSQKEAGAARVQAVGVVTSAVVVTQIFLAGFMPALAFWTVVPTIVVGLLLNYLNFKGGVNGTIWKTWNKLIGLGGLAVLPLVLSATFLPVMSYWPAIVTVAAGLTFMILQSLGKLPKKLDNIWSSLSAWTATMLFMFGPVAQLVNNLANPANLAGISLLTLLLGTAGNALMLPRAVLTKDRIWFAGSYWAVAVGGWVIMLSMLIYGALSPAVFLGFCLFLPLFTGFIFRQAAKHHGESFWKSIRFLFRGK